MRHGKDKTVYSGWHLFTEYADAECYHKFLIEEMLLMDRDEDINCVYLLPVEYMGARYCGEQCIESCIGLLDLYTVVADTIRIDIEEIKRDSRYRT